MDDKILIALIGGSAGLIGAVIGGGLTIIAEYCGQKWIWKAKIRGELLQTFAGRSATTQQLADYAVGIDKVADAENSDRLGKLSECLDHRDVRTIWFFDKTLARLCNEVRTTVKRLRWAKAPTGQAQSEALEGLDKLGEKINVRLIEVQREIFTDKWNGPYSP